MKIEAYAIGDEDLKEVLEKYTKEEKEIINRFNKDLEKIMEKE